MTDVRFIALYEDGSEEPFDVPQHTLRDGDWIVRIIARERQTEPLTYPRLKPGKIVRVYRNQMERLPTQGKAESKFSYHKPLG